MTPRGEWKEEQVEATCEKVDFVPQCNIMEMTVYVLGWAWMVTSTCPVLTWLPPSQF